MLKSKQLIILLACVCLALVAGLTFVVWNRNNNSKIIRMASTSTPNSENRVLSGSESKQTSELQIAPDDSTNNLGQMPQSSGTQPKTNSSTNSSNSSAANILDPSTFKQYDSYKNDKSALFKDLLVGDGAELNTNKKAVVLYKVWLTNGTLVDASRPNENGELEPFVFTVGGGQVIQAWDTSLTGMKVGGVRFLVVPPAVGYGASQKGNIPPNSVLVFQIQLMAVE